MTSLTGRPASGTRRAPRRLWLLPPLTAAWLWASSPFAPWALSLAPLTWLYDLLYYARYGLLAWAVLDGALAVRAWPEASKHGRRSVGEAVPVGLSALLVVAWLLLDATEAGWRARVDWSREALARESEGPAGPDRHRAGFFLVDARQFPCGSSVWLWLGQPFGAGQGTSVALVRDGGALPRTPDTGTYRFWRLDDEWWVAYQDGRRYLQQFERGTAATPEGPCRAGTTVGRHRDGLAFVEGGTTWRARR